MALPWFSPRIHMETAKPMPVPQIDRQSTMRLMALKSPRFTP
jgi:hypothetical protein